MGTLMSDYTDWGELSKEICEEIGLEPQTVYIKNSLVYDNFLKQLL